MRVNIFVQIHGEKHTRVDYRTANLSQRANRSEVLRALQAMGFSGVSLAEGIDVNNVESVPKVEEVGQLVLVSCPLLLEVSFLVVSALRNRSFQPHL